MQEKELLIEQKAQGMLMSQGKRQHGLIEITDKPFWGSFDDYGNPIDAVQQRPSNAKTELHVRELRELTPDMVQEQAHRAAKLSCWANNGIKQTAQTKELCLQNHGGRVHTTVELSKSYIVPASYDPVEPPAADPDYSPTASDDLMGNTKQPRIDQQSGGE